MVQERMEKKASDRLLLICVLAVLVSSFFVSRIQSSFGDVQVRDIKIPTHNGQWVAGDLFKPNSATSDNPAPLIVVIQYATLAATGMVYWTDGWLYVNLLFAVIPMMFVLPFFNRYFFA